MPSYVKQLSRKQADHIRAKRRFHEMRRLHTERNPKMVSDDPDGWKPDFAYIQGFKHKGDVVEADCYFLLKQLTTLRDVLIDKKGRGAVAEVLARMEEKIYELVDPVEDVEPTQKAIEKAKKVREAKALKPEPEGGEPL